MDLTTLAAYRNLRPSRVCGWFLPNNLRCCSMRPHPLSASPSAVLTKII